MPEEWLKKYVTLAGVGTPEGDHLRFRRTQVGLLDVLLAEQPEARFDERFEQARERLRQFQGIEPADPPAGFQGELRGYQRDGLGWLHFLREFGFGGCLADDMGLGKTVQVLALLEARRELRAAARKRRRPPPSLVVVPRSLVFNWKQEAARFTPEAPRPRPHRHRPRQARGAVRRLRRHPDHLRHAPERHRRPQGLPTSITPSSTRRRRSRTRAASRPRRPGCSAAEHRLALSGTPVENHLGELWSLFEFLNPGMLGKAAELGKADVGLAQRRRGGPAAPGEGPAAVHPPAHQGAGREGPAREDRADDLLRPGARPAQALRRAARALPRTRCSRASTRDGIRKSKIQILEALLRLRQAACHPGLIDKAKRSGESSAKLDVLLPQLREVVEEGHKALVFSQFTSLLAIVRQRLDEEGIPYEYLDGRTRDRAGAGASGSRTTRTARCS